jgi:anti-anti-sigma factor
MRFNFSQQGAVGVVQIEGVMISGELESLTETLRKNSAHGQPRLLLDFSAVSAMDSAALELTLETQETCRRRGGVVKLTGLNPLIREIFTVTGLDRRFEFFDSQLKALGSFTT